MQKYLSDPNCKYGIIAGASVATLTSIYLLNNWGSGGVNTHAPDLTGKLCLVTGGTDGIGMEAAREILRLGARVIITGRSKAKAQRFIDSLPSGSLITFIQVDYVDLNNVKALAEQLLSTEERLDMLINNAGIFYPDFKQSAQGVEFQHAVNHVAPFYLTWRLLPLLKKAPAARIVNVASKAHIRYHEPADNILAQTINEETFNSLKMYQNSKFNNVIYTGQFAKWLETQGLNTIKAVNLHPGVVRTSFLASTQKSSLLVRTIVKVFYPLLYLVTKSAVDGAQTTLHCALAPTEDLKSGAYYSDCAEKAVHPDALIEEYVNASWRQTQQVIRDTMGEETYVNL